MLIQTDGDVEPAAAAVANLAVVAKEGAGIYVFHADTQGMNFRRALVEGGWKLAQCCVWVKQTLVMGRQGIPLAARADSLRLEARSLSPLVHRQEADHSVELR